MNKKPIQQRGVALVVALLFLLVVTVISIVAANNSTLGLRMSANMQDAYESFQSAEAGIIAALAMANSGADPFDGDGNLTPFSTLASGSHPLRDLPGDPNSVDVDVLLTTAGSQCPRTTPGFSTELLACDYYAIEAEHQLEQKSRTKVELGVVKTIIGSAAR
ncbi:MAG: PilX N-terminal domain-containing pilus assembly protein [Halioglobus sp.]